MPAAPVQTSAHSHIARAVHSDTAQRSLSLAEAQLRSEAEAAAAAAAAERILPDLARIAVIGAGTMGSTVAMAAAAAGLDVVLIDVNPARLSAASANIERWSARSVNLGAVQYSADLQRIAGSGVVIESILEDAALKAELFASVEELVGPETLIASNTSSLDIDLLAARLRERGRFLGTHFFLPAHRIPVVELVRGAGTTAESLQQARALACRLGKLPVCVGNAPGFVGNRLFDRLWQEAVFMVEEGALPWEIDAALETWGLALGPFATLDRIGLNLIDSVLARQRRQNPDTPLPALLAALCEAGRTGVGVGRGWFDYEAGSRRGAPSGEVQQLLQRWSHTHNRERRAVPQDEIVARPVLAVIDEAKSLLARGIASRPGDIDVIFTRAFGFPAWSGGPLCLADTIGPAALQSDAALFPHRRDTRWRPAPAAHSSIRSNQSTEGASRP